MYVRHLYKLAGVYATRWLLSCFVYSTHTPVQVYNNAMESRAHPVEQELERVHVDNGSIVHEGEETSFAAARSSRKGTNRFSLEDLSWLSTVYNAHVMNTTFRPANLGPDRAHLWPNSQSLMIAAQKYSGMQLPVVYNHTTQRIGTVQRLWTDVDNSAMFVTMLLGEEGSKLAEKNQWCSPLFTVRKRKGDPLVQVEFHDFSLVPDGGLNCNNTYRSFDEEAKLKLAASRCTDFNASEIKINEDGTEEMQFTFAACRIIPSTESACLIEERGGVITFMGKYECVCTHLCYV